MLETWLLLVALIDFSVSGISSLKAALPVYGRGFCMLEIVELNFAVAEMLPYSTLFQKVKKKQGCLRKFNV